MKPVAQRIAIAEACGWTCCGQVTGCVPHGYPPDVRKPTTKELIAGTGPDPWDIPDFLNDLNMMHVAVMNMPPKTRSLFRKELQYMIAPRTKPGPVCQVVLMCSEDYDSWFHATAAQRAEAFLRTIGKWKEGE